MALRLNIIAVSTRPERTGFSIARWFDGFAREDGRFDAHLVDLAEVNLPIYDEPRHPRLRQYEHEHTRRWSAIVDAADAFVFVTPEYNFGPSPALLNALNFVYQEWNYKPAGFVSYGGISGGLRGVQAAKLTMSAMKLVTLPEAVTIPMVGQQIEDGTFTPKEPQVEGATMMLTELQRWATALKPMRDAPESL